MELRGIHNGNGTYTVTIKSRWKLLRKFVLWALTLRQPREVLVRDDRHIIFDRLPRGTN